MPRYDYLCRACRERFIIERGIKEDEGLILCPKCQASDVARDYSGVGFGGKAGQSHGCSGGSCSGGGCSGCGH